MENTKFIFKKEISCRVCCQVFTITENNIAIDVKEINFFSNKDTKKIKGFCCTCKNCLRVQYCDADIYIKEHEKTSFYDAINYILDTCDFVSSQSEQEIEFISNLIFEFNCQYNKKISCTVNDLTIEKSSNFFNNDKHLFRTTDLYTEELHCNCPHCNNETFSQFIHDNFELSLKPVNKNKHSLKTYLMLRNFVISKMSVLEKEKIDNKNKKDFFTKIAMYIAYIVCVVYTLCVFSGDVFKTAIITPILMLLIYCFMTNLSIIRTSKDDDIRNKSIFLLLFSIVELLLISTLMYMFAVSILKIIVFTILANIVLLLLIRLGGG